MRSIDLDLRSLPDSASTLYLVLKPNLSIVCASEAYRRKTLLWDQRVEGQHMFDVFPDNPNDPGHDGVKNLDASLAHVLNVGAAHRMAIQRYDVRDHVCGDEHWVEKYWAPVNRPIFGRGSREVAYLLHEVVDVSGAVGPESGTGLGDVGGREGAAIGRAEAEGPVQSAERAE